jgi:hypothetical protein
MENTSLFALAWGKFILKMISITGAVAFAVAASIKASFSTAHVIQVGG